MAACRWPVIRVPCKSGMDVILESPEGNQCLNTPMKKLVNGQIYITIAPTASVVSYHTMHKEYPVVSIAAVQQFHNSAKDELGIGANLCGC